MSMDMISCPKCGCDLETVRREKEWEEKQAKLQDEVTRYVGENYGNELKRPRRRAKVIAEGLRFILGVPLATTAVFIICVFTVWMSGAKSMDEIGWIAWGVILGSALASVSVAMSLTEKLFSAVPREEKILRRAELKRRRGYT